MDIRHSDQYLTVAKQTETLFKEKGSKFISYVLPCSDDLDLTFALNEIKDLHPKANHHCYAWRLGLGTESYRVNDDGEPSGTAGRPILGQIDKFELTDVLIIVVRYFGGTKLGVSGLIQAYKSAAALGIEASNIIVKTIHQKVRISCDYEVYNRVEQVLAKMDVEVLSRELSTNCNITISFPKSKTEYIIDALKVGITNDYLENVKDQVEFDHFKIDLIE